jgi:hypothetical protein
MGFWKGLRKLAVVTTKVAAKGVGGAAKVVYNHRDEIASATKTVAKATVTTIGVAGYGTYKAAEWTVKKVVDHRREIGGATVGAVKGIGNALVDTSAHTYARDENLRPILERIKIQSEEYREHTRRIYGRIANSSSSVRNRDVLLDALVIGGHTVADYASFAVNVPKEIDQAYQLAYPHVAAGETFVEQVRSLPADALPGFVQGVKGKLFEMKYVEYLNDGNLLPGYEAKLADSVTQRGHDIEVIGPDKHVADLIQAKASDSVAYIKDAIEKYPGIDVVTTSEVYSHLVMQGFAENVVDSGISEAALESTVAGAADAATVNFSWMPSAVALALIAFSAYSEEGLNAYQKSRNFGERSAKSYLAYLAGGALALATGTWWIGVLGGIGTRVIMGTGAAKRQRLHSLKQLAQQNDVVLARLRGHQ